VPTPLLLGALLVSPAAAGAQDLPSPRSEALPDDGAPDRDSPAALATGGAACPELPPLDSLMLEQEYRPLAPHTTRFRIRGPRGTVGYIQEPRIAPRWLVGQNVFETFAGAVSADSKVGRVHEAWAVGRKLIVRDCHGRIQYTLHERIIEDWMGADVCRNRTTGSACASTWEVWDARETAPLAYVRKEDLAVTRMVIHDARDYSPIATLERTSSVSFWHDVRWGVVIHDHRLPLHLILALAALKTDRDVGQEPATPSAADEPAAGRR
jgi:hypothetical protein